MRGKQRWQDWVSLALGAVVAVFAIAALWRPESPTEEWVNLVLGLWLVIAPFALGFYASEAVAAWNHFVVGALIAGDAVWAMSVQSKAGGEVPHY